MNNIIVPQIALPDYRQDHFSRLNSQQMIATTLHLFCQGSIVGIRCIGAYGKTSRIDSGYFDDFQRAAEAIVKSYDKVGSSQGIFFMPNPINAALLARANNRIKPYAHTPAEDAYITRRKWLPVICDAKRPSGISATDEEAEQVWLRACQIAHWLVDRGFCRPIFARNGNGADLHFPISLPNDEASLALVAGVLRTLGSMFSTDLVSIDQSMSKAASNCRLYGTTARIGDATHDRLHRTSCLEFVPGNIWQPTGEFCDIERLRAVAAIYEPM